MLICRRKERFAKRVNDFVAFTGAMVLGCVLGKKNVKCVNLDKVTDPKLKDMTLAEE
jgi:hypothetical protein